MKIPLNRISDRQRGFAARLLIIIFSVVIIVGIIFLMPGKKTTPGEPKIAKLNSEELIQRVSTAKSESRTLATALKSFYIDNKTYPATLGSLTTPIAYLIANFDDPFLEPGQTFQFHSVKNGWIVWSPGPDGKYD